MVKRLQIIVPLMARSASKDWQRTCALLSHSLNSARSASDDSVRVLVVGHDVPEAITFDDRCEWLQVAFDPPADGAVASKMADKGQKTLSGVRYTSRRDLAEWVIFMDADDVISKRLLKLADLTKHDAVCLAKGYRWFSGKASLEMVPNFHLRCGTSWIMKLTQRNFPVWLGGATDGGVCDQTHSDRLSGLRRIGASVQMIREPCAIYVTGHGVNSYVARGSYQQAWKGRLKNLRNLALSWGRRRRLTEAIRQEFGLPRSQV